MSRFLEVLALASIALQVVAALGALWLIRKTGRVRAWLFLALALALAVVLRVDVLAEFGSRWLGTFFESPAVEVVLGFAVSLCFALGVLFFGQTLEGLARRGQELAAAQRLAEEERRKLSELLERLPVGVVVEREGAVAYANATVGHLLGIPKPFPPGSRVEELVWVEDRSVLSEVASGSSDGVQRRELRLLTASGKPLWVAARVHRAVWMGAPARIWVFADISEQKAHEAEKAAAEALFSQGPVVLVSWRPAPDRSVAYVSENVRQWGFDPQKLVSEPQDFYEFCHPEDRQRVQEEAQSFFNGGAASWSQEYRLLCPDGKVRWVLDRTVVVRDEAGHVVGFNGYLLDVTEVKESRQALEVERERFAAALEATGEVVYDWNVESGEISWNRAVEKAFGYPPETMGDIEAWNQHIHPEDRARVEALLAESLATGVPFEAEYRFQRANGSYVPVLDRGKVEFDAEGKPVRMVGAMADLSTIKKLEEQLRLAQRLEALGQLAGGVAHDFNNLLTAILGTVDLLERRLPPDSAAAADARVIREVGQRAAQLTRQLLAFARRQVMEPQYLDLNAHLEKALAMLRRLLPETIHVDFIPGRQLGTVYADPGQLDQVLMNLAVNARDAMPQGGVLTIETENVLVNGEYVRQHPWAKEGRYVLLAVSDTGVGMDSETLQRAFEPFFTTKGPGKGTGLGLATVYGIVKQHDGLVHLYSEPGKGTTVKIYLPVVERRAVDVGPKVEGPVEGGSETILLVEDEESVRAVLSEALAGLGYRVLTAADGQAALEVLERENYAVDLVLTDVVMPRMGGWELYEQAREKSSSLLFLFSTGYSENAVHENFRKKPGIFLISKPYGLDTLARKVREVLDSRAKR